MADSEIEVMDFPVPRCVHPMMVRNAIVSCECIMPSLIKIGANGRCKGYHKRQSGKKK